MPKLTKINLILFFILLLFLAILSSNKYVVHFNADTLILSIMSIQKMTLFYWGQDRLLNIFPFLASFINDPFYNIFFMASLSFFFLYSSFFIVSLFLFGKNTYSNNYFFTILCILVSHIVTYNFLDLVVPGLPYTLSFLLISLYYIIFREYNTKNNILSCLTLSILIIHNPSCILVFCFIFFIQYANFFSKALFLEKKKIFFRDTFNILIAASIIFLLRKYYFESASSTYYNINFENFQANTYILISKYLNTINYKMLFAFYCISFAIFPFTKIEMKYNQKIFIKSALLFSMLWFPIIAQNQHVINNQYAPRYSSLISFIVILCLCLRIYHWNIQKYISKKILISVIIILQVMITFDTWKKISAFDSIKRNFDNISLIQTFNIKFISGNYWDGWPIVLYFLGSEKNKERFGILNRGKANIENVIESIKKEKNTQNEITLACIKESSARCTDLLRQMLPKGIAILQDEIKQTDSMSFIRFQIEDFDSLHSSIEIPAVQLQQTNTKRTIDKKSISTIEGATKEGGFTFGPYITLPVGTYKISIDYDLSQNGKVIWDMISVPLKIVYFSEQLSANKHLTVQFVDITKETQRLEIRTHYLGEGNFKFKSISISRTN